MISFKFHTESVGVPINLKQMEHSCYYKLFPNKYGYQVVWKYSQKWMRPDRDIYLGKIVGNHNEVKGIIRSASEHRDLRIDTSVGPVKGDWRKKYDYI